MRQIVLDTETTGLDIANDHRIIEIACVEIINRKLTNNTYQTYLNPERQVGSSFKIHGLSDDFLSDKPAFKTIYQEFLDFIKDSELLIHNAEFDIGHLNNELSLINREKISKVNVIDTLEIARNKFPGSSISLDALCKRFKIDNSRRIKHTALIDCDLLSKVYINLIDQREPIFQFKKELDNNELSLENSESYSKKIIKPSNEEFEQHKKFIKDNFKRNFF